MPLASVDRVEKSIYTTAQNTTLMGLVLYGKDNGRQLRFTTPSYADTLRVHESIQTYAFPGRRNLGYLFAFESKRDQVMNSLVIDPATGKKTITLEPTRKRFDAVTEFSRQFAHMQPCPWTIYTKVNINYQLCMSYPSILAGPSSLPEVSQETQRILRQSAAFRSEQRLPVLTWSNGKDGTSLWRAAQPKVGLQGNRSAADEQFLQQIQEAAFSANSLATKPPIPPKWVLQKLIGTTDLSAWMPDRTTRLKILDLRPRASAMANRTSGYGYENTSNYVGCTLQFCGIGNIHAVRDASNKIASLCNSQTTNDSSWATNVEDTKWLSHIRTILSASWEAAYWMHIHRLPVFLHCSHGWDRTSQVAVLAQLILDPYFRTMDGFVTLIEKDFLAFGHPFHTRCAHGEGRGGEGPNVGDDSQISPIFIQFIDAAYQLVNLFPSEFEITPLYLKELASHVYSCRFGTLLCDTERERELVAGIRQRTHSVWDHLERLEGTRNLDYNGGSSGGVLLMPLPLLLRNVNLWVDRHCQYGPKVTAV
uniref:Myotubularin phosphatase domain-containing protein n=1 Tax=Cyclophora tenuis TaxID=216820 RepID=A0A7S1D538_CYCTE